MGGGLRKVRLAIKSKGKGKRAGARIIFYVFTSEKEVYLLSIYDKSQINSLSDKALEELVKQAQSIQ